jgi:hypothetical protein
MLAAAATRTRSCFACCTPSAACAAAHHHSADARCLQAAAHNQLYCPYLPQRMCVVLIPVSRVMTRQRQQRLVCLCDTQRIWDPLVASCKRCCIDCILWASTLRFDCVSQHSKVAGIGQLHKPELHGHLGQMRGVFDWLLCKDTHCTLPYCLQDDEQAQLLPPLLLLVMCMK